MTTFWNLAQAHTNDFMSGYTSNIITFVDNFTALRLHQAGNSAQGCGLACTVGANQRYNFTIGNIEADAFNGVDSAVIDINIFNS